MKWLFNIMINLLATLVQIVCIPINSAINSALPDLSNTITQVTTAIGTAFTGMGWALSFLPIPVVRALTFIIGVEIAKHTIFISTHALIKIWNLFQKIKFW